MQDPQSIQSIFNEENIEVQGFNKIAEGLQEVLQSGDVKEQLKFFKNLVLFITSLSKDKLEISSKLSLLAGHMLEQGVQLGEEEITVAIQLVKNKLEQLDEVNTDIEQNNIDAKGFDEAGQQFQVAIQAIVTRYEQIQKEILVPKYQKIGVNLRHKFNFIHKITNLLQKEQILVLDIENQSGYDMEIYGITDNFQLHTLMANELSTNDVSKNDYQGIKVNGLCLLILNGQQEYCQQSSIPLVGHWNMYNWSAIKTKLGDQEVVQINSDIVDPQGIKHYIWGEGVPMDIMECPELNNKRVIILGKPLYQRSFSCTRDFQALKADVKIQKVYEKDEIKQIFQKLYDISEEKKLQAVIQSEKDTAMKINF